MPAADLGEAGQIQNAIVRIGRRLADERPRGGPDGVLEGVVVAHRHRRHLDPVPMQGLVEELARAAIAVVGDDHVGAPRQHGEERRRRRRHPAREEQAVLGALEGGELGLGDPLGRVAVPPVLHPFGAPLEVILELLGVGEGVGRGLHDGRGQGVTGLRARLAPVHGQRARPEEPGLARPLPRPVDGAGIRRLGHHDTRRRARSTWRAMARATCRGSAGSSTGVLRWAGRMPSSAPM
jgi:hypothetical protein